MHSKRKETNNAAEIRSAVVPGFRILPSDLKCESKYSKETSPDKTSCASFETRADFWAPAFFAMSESGNSDRMTR